MTSVEEQQAETYRYWQSRTSIEQMEAVAEIVKGAYLSKGSTSMLDHQKELLSVLKAHEVKYLVVGGHTVGLYAEPRGTKDLASS